MIADGAHVFSASGSIGDYSPGNTALINGTGSVWRITGGLDVGGGPLYVYNLATADNLTVSGGGQLFDNMGTLGSGSGGSNNSALVTDSGSVWSNQSTLYIGFTSAGNTLVISNGGLVASETSIVGVNNDSGNDNSVLVTGPNSRWSNAGTVTVGPGSDGNSLVISNGGAVTCMGNFSGCGTVGGTNNSARVVDGGVWESTGSLQIGGPVAGYCGLSNSLIVDGGTIQVSNLFVACSNLIELDSGGMFVTNSTATAVLEVRGKLVLGGGTLQADTLVITNSCAQFIHTGGTLIVGNVVLDPNTLRIVSVTPTGNDILITWMMGPGATNTLQATAGNGTGGYSTNGFSDIVIVTNNTTVGTVTSYRDLGAATNTSVRYYRARLIP